jgi:hypothetical protein
MRLAETSAPPKPLSRGSAGAQGARPRRHAARHETLRHGDMGRWFTSFRLYGVPDLLLRLLLLLLLLCVRGCQLPAGRTATQHSTETLVVWKSRVAKSCGNVVWKRHGGAPDLLLRLLLLLLLLCVRGCQLPAGHTAAQHSTDALVVWKSCGSRVEGRPHDFHTSLGRRGAEGDGGAPDLLLRLLLLLLGLSMSLRQVISLGS